jgi:hypothetical protein
MRWTLEHDNGRVRNSGVAGLRSLLGLPLNQLRVLEAVADDLKIIPMRCNQLRGISMPDCERPRLIDEQYPLR